MFGVAEDLVGRALLHDLAAVHEHDTAGNFLGKAQLVGHDHHGHAFFSQLLQACPILLVVTQMNSVAVFIYYYSYKGISTEIVINANEEGAAKAVRCVWFYLHSNSEVIL